MDWLKKVGFSFLIRALMFFLKVVLLCYLTGLWLLCIIFFCFGWMENMQEGIAVSTALVSLFESNIFPVKLLAYFWQKFPHIDFFTLLTEVNGLDGFGELLEGLSKLGEGRVTLQEQINSQWGSGVFKLVLMNFFYFLFSRVNQFIMPKIDLMVGTPKEIIRKKAINSVVFFCISIPHVTASLFASIAVTEWFQSIVYREKAIPLFLLMSVVVLLLHTLLLANSMDVSAFFAFALFLIDVILSFLNSILVWFLFGIILLEGDLLLFPLVYMLIAFFLLLEDDLLRKPALRLVSFVFKRSR